MITIGKNINYYSIYRFRYSINFQFISIINEAKTSFQSSINIKIFISMTN